MKRLKNLVIGILLLVATHLFHHYWGKEMPDYNKDFKKAGEIVCVIALALLFLYLMVFTAGAQDYKLTFTDSIPRGFNGLAYCDKETHSPVALVRKGLTREERIGVLAHELMHIYRMSQLKPDCRAFSQSYGDSALYRLDEEIWAYAMRIKVGVAYLGWSLELSLDNYAKQLVDYRGFWEDRELLSKGEIRNLLKTRQDSLPPIPNELLTLVSLQENRPP